MWSLASPQPGMALIVAGTVARSTRDLVRAAFRRVGHRADQEGSEETSPPEGAKALGARLFRVQDFPDFQDADPIEVFIAQLKHPLHDLHGFQRRSLHGFEGQMHR